MAEPTPSGAGTADSVAITGIAGRFPGAGDVDALWRLIRAGEVAIRRFPAGNAGSIGAYGVLDDLYAFDADEFGISPGEAELLDPQHRQFAEVALLALEDAGIDPDRTEYTIGVYAGASPSTYDRLDFGDDDLSTRYARLIGNSPDFLATRVSYLLGLRGESMTVQTGCSSSLVAVHMAVQSLLAGLTDVALAGGVSIACDYEDGYLVQESMVASRTGNCRPFDHRADGAVPGNGLGAVTLKLLDRALADGDPVRAVIEGTAVNNDGRSKLGFMAPSVDGQSEVIATAMHMAGVRARDIGFVQAHGSATPLGDLIELQALDRAFRLDTADTGFCALGAIKGNVGHLDRAAGIAGLIAAVLAIEHREIPPLSGFEAPKPELGLPATAFYVPVKPHHWPGSPLRAGVSSFGVGGTNAHVVVRSAG